MGSAIFEMVELFDDNIRNELYKIKLVSELCLETKSLGNCLNDKDAKDIALGMHFLLDPLCSALDDYRKTIGELLEQERVKKETPTDRAHT